MTVDERFPKDAPDTADDELLGTRSEIITGPVSDWATDFSHLEPAWSADPYPIQEDLRRRCPIAHTDRFGGDLSRHRKALGELVRSGLAVAGVDYVRANRARLACRPRSFLAARKRSPPRSRPASR